MSETRPRLTVLFVELSRLNSHQPHEALDTYVCFCVPAAFASSAGSSSPPSGSIGRFNADGLFLAIDGSSHNCCVWYRMYSSAVAIVAIGVDFYTVVSSVLSCA